MAYLLMNDMPWMLGRLQIRVHVPKLSPSKFIEI
jgi:hypothetical protein